MRHFFRNDNGEFDDSGYGSIGFLPRGLMDNLLLSFLADCIRIGDAFRKDALNNRPGFFIVATQHVLASHIPVYRNRFVVLIDDIAVGIAYRDVWLPEGRWFDMSSGRMLEGNASYEVGYTLEEIPWFVRAGAVVPMAGGDIMNLRGENVSMVLTVVPGADGRTSLYEDDGTGKDYDRNYALTDIEHEVSDTSVRLKISPRRGTYDGMPEDRRYEVRFLASMPPARVMLDGAELPFDRFGGDRTWHYDGYDLAVVVETGATDCETGCEVLAEYDSAAACGKIPVGVCLRFVSQSCFYLCHAVHHMGGISRCNLRVGYSAVLPCHVMDTLRLCPLAISLTGVGKISFVLAVQTCWLCGWIPLTAAVLHECCIAPHTWQILFQYVGVAVLLPQSIGHQNPCVRPPHGTVHGAHIKVGTAFRGNLWQAAVFPLPVIEIVQIFLCKG